MREGTPRWRALSQHLHYFTFCPFSYINYIYCIWYCVSAGCWGGQCGKHVHIEFVPSNVKMYILILKWNLDGLNKVLSFIELNKIESHRFGQKLCFFFFSRLLFFKGLVIERIGRKPLLIFGFTAMAVFFSLLTVFLNLQVSILYDPACGNGCD